MWKFSCAAGPDKAFCDWWQIRGKCAFHVIWPITVIGLDYQFSLPLFFVCRWQKCDFECSPLSPCWFQFSKFWCDCELCWGRLGKISFKLSIIFYSVGQFEPCACSFVNFGYNFNLIFNRRSSKDDIISLDPFTAIGNRNDKIGCCFERFICFKWKIKRNFVIFDKIFLFWNDFDSIFEQCFYALICSCDFKFCFWKEFDFIFINKRQLKCNNFIFFDFSRDSKWLLLKVKIFSHTLKLILECDFVSHTEQKQGFVDCNSFGF